MSAETNQNPAYMIEYVVKCLVARPDEVKIDEIRNDNHSILELRVHDDDLGKVIGKNGRVAKSLRTLLLVANGQDEHRYSLEIVD